MAKLVKKQKSNKTKFYRFSVTLFIFSISCSLFGAIFLRNYNNSLAMKIEDCNRELQIIKTENEQLTNSISNLTKKDRVVKIAKDAGLNQNQNNVNNVIKGE